MPKTFVVTVIEDSKQSSAIISLKGYSHFTTRRDTRYLAGFSYPCRYAVILGYSNRAKLQKAVRETLGADYWQSVNFAEEFDPKHHA